MNLDNVVESRFDEFVFGYYMSELGQLMYVWTFNLYYSFL